MGKKLRMNMNIPVICPRALMRMRILIRDPGISLSLDLTRDPDGKKFGSEINIPDPQHWYGSTWD
jgi:hypothetical protein